MRKQDRRVKKTKKAFQTALLKLLTEKELRDISIRQLCDKADLSLSLIHILIYILVLANLLYQKHTAALLHFRCIG